MTPELLDLSTRIGAKLKESGRTIAAAESLTAGKVQDALASVSGSSSYFRGGFTAYTLDLKVGVLGVDREMAETCSCVSAPVAYQMAKGIRALCVSDIGIGTTGYAEPYGDVLVPYAHVCVMVGEKHISQILVNGNAEMTREQMRLKVVAEALATVALLLGV